MNAGNVSSKVMIMILIVAWSLSPSSLNSSSSSPTVSDFLSLYLFQQSLSSVTFFIDSKTLPNFHGHFSALSLVVRWTSHHSISPTITTLTSLTCSNLHSFDSTYLFLIADCFPLLQELDLSDPKSSTLRSFNRSSFLDGRCLNATFKAIIEKDNSSISFSF